jgi:2-oxo-4-hydroxy-4-carboxy--5-ureidoimidazoline (OHCU) decarboxylase
MMDSTYVTHVSNATALGKVFKHTLWGVKKAVGRDPQNEAEKIEAQRQNKRG